MQKYKKGFFDGVNPEDAFLDSSNLPGFNHSSAEGKLIKALSYKEVYTIGILFLLILIVFLYKTFNLQIIYGDFYKDISLKNTLSKSIIFAERGIITDRFGVELVWNEPSGSNLGFKDASNRYSLRKYINLSGLAHLLGYVSYPIADDSGYWWRTDFMANAGVELSMNNLLQGKNGHRLVEVDALGQVAFSGFIEPPKNGDTVMLTIDATLTHKLHESIKSGVNLAGFQGGAGVIMSVTTGEILAITSYPEYNPNILTDGRDYKTISAYNKDEGKPFLNRAVQGSYTPGSIIKPYMGAVALQEDIITENTKILSTGVLKVPNKYNPGQYTLFRDWRTGLGYLDIKRAIAMSSSIFFYVIGGGFESQPGLGISKISEWARIFGFGQVTDIDLPGEVAGLIPTPQWQKDTFGQDSVWRLGNTYHSSIGQYGWLVTPIQAAQYIASIANSGTLNTPVLQKNQKTIPRKIPIDNRNFNIVREGMYQAVQNGTARSLNIKGMDIAAKTGTAQLGEDNEFMNSWVVGFWPYENPEFAFVVVLERANAETLRGAAPAMQSFFTWMVTEHGDNYAIGQYPDTPNMSD